jgi:hypothetical protein
MSQHLEVLVEEPSMESALRLILPKMIGDATFEVYPHQCKSDLLNNLPNRLRGYAHWLPADWRIIVIVDRDRDDCAQLKNRLETVAAAAGMTTRAAGGNTIHVVNRLAVEELEAWFFGDWEAVKAAYPKVSASVPEKQGYSKVFDQACGRGGALHGRAGLKSPLSTSSNASTRRSWSRMRLIFSIAYRTVVW